MSQISPLIWEPQTSVTIVDAVLAVNVTGAIDLGIVGFGKKVVSDTAITITNTGIVNEKIYLSQISPEMWTPLGAVVETGPDSNQYVLTAIFNSTQPDVDECIKNDNVVMTYPVACTTVKYTGDQDGIDVAPGDNRTLYVGFMSPNPSIIDEPQDITLVVTVSMTLTTQNVNKYVLTAVFNTTKPTKSMCIKDDNVVMTYFVECNDVRYAGDQHGADVPAGESRTLWIGFISPNPSTTNEPQTIALIVTASVL